MASIRYTRIDGTKSSNYCSTIIIAVLVSSCLIGAWMATTSSSMDPEEYAGVTVGSTKDAIKQKVIDKGIEFEDTLGGLPQDGPPSERVESDLKTPESVNVGGSGQEEKVQKSSSGDNVGVDSNKEKEVESEIAKQVENDSVPQTSGDETPPKDPQETEINIGEPKNGSWSTQQVESEKQKGSDKSPVYKDQSSVSKNQNGYRWKVCNVTAGPDYIPCLDNIQAIKKLRSTRHYEHRERHCPQEAPTCLVPLPKGYKTSVKWPESREKIWFVNVPHVKLAQFKGHQNWVHVSGEYITFPGGGTQFIHGATRYINIIEQTLPEIAWGERSRVVLDVGCGVASFGGFLFDKDVLTMSLAPKDEHEAQVEFALERGIPAISAVMGTKRLPFPSMAFDIVHCARCRVPWHVEGGKLLLELDRLLRPGGFFVWSATPVYRKDEQNKAIWRAMSNLTKSMCWDLVKIGKDKVNQVSVAIYVKPTSNHCYESRTKIEPPLCEESDNANAAWDVPLKACIHKVPTDPSLRGAQFPLKWPSRLEKPPYWLKDSESGVYGKNAPKDFMADYMHWKRVVADSYLNGIGIDWSSVRNVMDMRAIYGGFAAALKDMKVWVMNVVPVTSSDTLAIIYERGLFGIYHDWCESFSTYPRSYDLLHADYLFSDVKKRCNIMALMAEVDRILRPGGSLIVKDNTETILEVEKMAQSLQWQIKYTFSKGHEGLLCAQKTRWRPKEVETIKSAIA